LRRAAVLGATAHVASKHGQAKEAAAEQHQAEMAAPPSSAAPAAPAPDAGGASSADGYEELMRLKGLLDAGVLTQAEFDAQKQLVLSGSAA